MAFAKVNPNTKDRVTNILNVTAAADTVYGDLIIHGPWVGVALNDALTGAALTIDIEDGREIDAISAVSGVGSAVGDDVFYNPTTGAYAAAAADGSYLVGNITVVKNSDNVFRFEKLRRHVAYAAQTFAGLLDVDVAGVTDNDTLKYVASTGKWTDVAV
jgi:predicted RecA/RadA family phage recombinase